MGLAVDEVGKKEKLLEVACGRTGEATSAVVVQVDVMDNSPLK